MATKPYNQSFKLQAMTWDSLLSNPNVQFSEISRYIPFSL